MQRELGLGVTLVAIEQSWLEVWVREYPNFALASCQEDFGATPTKGNLVGLPCLLV